MARRSASPLTRTPRLDIHAFYRARTAAERTFALAGQGRQAEARVWRDRARASYDIALRIGAPEERSLNRLHLGRLLYQSALLGPDYERKSGLEEALRVYESAAQRAAELDPLRNDLLYGALLASKELKKTRKWMEISYALKNETFGDRTVLDPASGAVIPMPGLPSSMP